VSDHCDLKNKQDGVLDKDKTMGNVQKHNIFTVKRHVDAYWLLRDVE
jgi:hypothetical protein